MNLNSSLESQISTVNDNHVNVSNSSAGHIIQGRLTGSNIGVYIYINRLSLGLFLDSNYQLMIIYCIFDRQ